MERMERARRAAGPSATPRVRLARQRRRAPPLPGERAVRTARGCARLNLPRFRLHPYAAVLAAPSICLASSSSELRRTTS